MIEQRDNKMATAGGLVDSIKQHSDEEIPDDAFQLPLKSYQVMKRSENKKLDLLESRGSAMLKAALNDKNRQENNPSKKQKDPVISRMIELERAHIQQANASSKNKKRLRNNVIFREPVVSQEYEYEPTQLPEPIVVANNTEITTHIEPTIERRIFSDRKINFNNNVQITNSNPNKLFLCAFDEDDDEGVFVSDSSSGKTDEDIPVRKPVKRPYESIDESCGEQSHQQLTQGLFSSPKVAKIAPYFEEKPRDKLDLETRETQPLTKNCQHPYKSRSIPSKIYQVRNKQKDFMKKKSIEDCPDSNSRLISYKRNCNNISENDTNMKSKQEPNQNSAFWPFNWLSSGFSFITNQVDKLIFQ